jgi:hypothetical protein
MPSPQRVPACRAFQGRHGRAYLVGRAVNYVAGKPEERVLMTGLHTGGHCVEAPGRVGAELRSKVGAVRRGSAGPSDEAARRNAWAEQW